MRNILVSVLALALAGCAAQYGTAGLKGVSPSQMQNEMAAVKTAKDAESKYGKPQFVYKKDDGSQTQEFVYSRKYTRFNMWIPIVSLFMHDYRCVSKSLYLDVAPDGSIRDYKFVGDDKTCR